MQSAWQPKPIKRSAFLSLMKHHLNYDDFWPPISRLEKDEKAGFKPSNHCIYWVFRFVVIIPYGHSCASLLLANGISMKQIQIWLGHSTFSTTADIYSHLDFHAQIESGLVMDGMFERNRVAEPTGLAAANWFSTDCFMGIQQSLIKQGFRHIRFL